MVNVLVVAVILFYLHHNGNFTAVIPNCGSPDVLGLQLPEILPAALVVKASENVAKLPL